MDDYRAAIPNFYPAVPDFYPVIPAKAGIQRVANNVVAIRPLAFDSRERLMPTRPRAC